MYTHTHTHTHTHARFQEGISEADSRIWNRWMISLDPSEYFSYYSLYRDIHYSVAGNSEELEITCVTINNKTTRWAAVWAYYMGRAESWHSRCSPHNSTGAEYEWWPRHGHYCSILKEWARLKCANIDRFLRHVVENKV